MYNGNGLSTAHCRNIAIRVVTMEMVDDNPRVCSHCNCWIATPQFVHEECVKHLEPDVHVDTWSDKRLVGTMKQLTPAQRATCYNATTDPVTKKTLVHKLIDNDRLAAIDLLTKLGLSMTRSSEDGVECGLVYLVRSKNLRAHKLVKRLLESEKVSLTKKYDQKTLWKWAIDEQALKVVMIILQYAKREKIEPYASLGGDVSADLNQLVDSVSRKLRESFSDRRWVVGMQRTLVELSATKPS